MDEAYYTQMGMGDIVCKTQFINQLNCYSYPELLWHTQNNALPKQAPSNSEKKAQN